MTVSTTNQTVTYTGNGAATSFDIPFKPVAAQYIFLTRITIATGVEQAISESLYNVVVDNDGEGGTLTYPLSGPPLSSDYRIRIDRVLPVVQNASLDNQDGYYPKVVEGALDYLTLVIQQLEFDFTQYDARIDELDQVDLTTEVAQAEASADAAAASETAAAASAAAAAATAAAMAPSAATTTGELNFPIGHMILVLLANQINRNQIVTPRLGSSGVVDPFIVAVYMDYGSGNLLAGTWRTRGLFLDQSGQEVCLAQRVA